MTGTPILCDHDGGLDDYLSTMLLLTMDHLDILGIVVTPADCYIKPAVSATRKILDLMGRSTIPVAESTVRGLNPFPRQFRRTSFSVDLLPILNEQETITTPLAPESGQAFMARVLRDAPEPVTILEIGPLTTVAAALEIAPEIEAKIKQIIWMGGALNVPGNVAPVMEGGQDGSMEWNVYWDPLAAHRLWQTSIPIVLCPLDITNTVPVKPDFVRQLGRQRRYPISDLAGQCYAMVMHQDYWFWDVLTTAYLGRPDFYHLREWETIIIPEGRSQGRTKIEPGGKRIQVMDQVDRGAFYDYILTQWQC
jgi:purine nucleosidase